MPVAVSMSSWFEVQHVSQAPILDGPRISHLDSNAGHRPRPFARRDFAAPNRPMTSPAIESPVQDRVGAGTILAAFLRLGCTSFGGPIAHLGYFRDEFVTRRHWLEEAHFAEIIAVAQTLPGPASSQVGFTIGLIKGGWPGAFAAWAGFTLPSAALMV